MTGRRISTSADFPRAVVYENAGPGGGVYTVAFDNAEFSGGREMLSMIAGILVLLASAAFSGTLGDIALWLGLPAFAGSVATAAYGVYLMVRVFWPWTIRRAIELDFARDELRVLKGARTVLTRPLSRLANLTVEDHPDAELARQQRQQNGQKAMKNSEKTHCLIGWFGVGGAEQVMLLTRAEYPSRHSLFEVQQAVRWVMDRASSGAASAPHTDGAKRRTDETIKPPLD
jgi:hypothetical protein